MVISTLRFQPSIKNIGSYAFAENQHLTSVILSENIETIGYYAFTNCINLETINLPSSLKQIGDYAFFGCTGLKNVVIGSGVQRIGNYAFSESGLESIAFCCISTGEFHFPNEEAALIALHEVQVYHRAGGACHVIFNVFGDKDWLIYDQLLNEPE